MRVWRESHDAAEQASLSGALGEGLDKRQVSAMNSVEDPHGEQSWAGRCVEGQFLLGAHCGVCKRGSNSARRLETVEGHNGAECSE